MTRERECAVRCVCVSLCLFADARALTCTSLNCVARCVLLRECHASLADFGRIPLTNAELGMFLIFATNWFISNKILSFFFFKLVKIATKYKRASNRLIKYVSGAPQPPPPPLPLP